MRRTLGLRVLSVGVVLATTATALGGPPSCSYDELPARITPEGDGRWTVLDTVYALPADWEPTDLTSLREAGFDDGRTVRSVVIPDLAALREAAEADGVHLEILSAYRSFDYQAATFASWVEQDGYQVALVSSARPGHSEHQLGTAIDLRSRGGPAPWELGDWATTPAGAWMRGNAWRFGFVMSYPPGAQQRSCYVYEPWHWRWVGRELAAELARSGQLLRERLWEVTYD